MNISEFEKPANEKLAKINEALDTLYGFRVYDTIDIKKLYDVKKDLEKEIKNFISTEIEWIPINCVEVSKKKNEDLINFFNTLEEDDDVQNIYTNAQFVE